ncbi:MAG: hypothetical protein ACJ76V_02980 [Thermoleophilaceae bacterium]
MTETLERGDIFFFYRPRVGVTEVRGLADVQRTFLVLKPDRRRRYRRLIVGRKRLPDPLTHEREWAFVAEVAESPADFRDDIAAVEYETKTRGRRFQPEARPAGEGRYAIVDHDGHTHLAYELELPREPGAVQQMLCIEKEASHIVAVANPETPVRGVGLRPDRRAQFPAELQERFRGRRFSPLIPPDFLDYEGAEVVLIGAAKDARAELGIELDTEEERVEDADIFRKLRSEPLISGNWR